MSLETYGKYQLLKKLATGGMAQIWLARQQGLEGFEKLLVVKRILPHLAENDDFIKMFLDEARIAARLNHPNVVQIFDLGAQDDSYFIAMEYIHGEDVRRVWKRAEAVGRPVPIPLVCRIIMDACAGLDYAHKKLDQSGRPLNIVHRDISPQNILVTFEGGVKVVDFGIAKAADQATVTKSGVLKGKYSYMSPEQASGKKIDSRTDIFALGVVLYELLTGTRLFKRSNDIQTLNAVTECQVAPPSEVNARLPKDLDPVVLKALAKNADDRYQEAGHLQAALEDWLLQNKLPSGSGHLATFMQEIYAERLAREAEEGRVLIEELDARIKSVDEESPRKATPAGKGRPTTSLRASGPQGERKSASLGAPRPALGADAEVTTAERGARSGTGGSAARRDAAGRGEARGNTEVSKTVPGRRRLPLLVAAASMVVGAGVAAALWFTTAPVEVRLTSTPPGAQVRFDGKLLRDVTTPCRLPARPAGRYEVVVSKTGYQEQRLLVDYPGSGTHTVDAVLQPEQVVEPPPVADAGPPEPVDAGAVEVAPPRPRVALLLKTQPPGARLRVNGQELGPAPQRLEVDADAQVAVVAELNGYSDATQTFPAGAGPTLERTLVLKKLTRPQVVHANTGTTTPPPPKQYGKVRFVVNPWAVVVCGGKELGQTPFPEADLPAGEIACTFTNPDLGVKKQVVSVVANDKVTVRVKFE